MVQPYPLEFLCHVCASSCRFQCAFPANSQHQVCLSEDCSLAAWSMKASSWKCTSLGAVFSQWWLSANVLCPIRQDHVEAVSRTYLQGSYPGQHPPVVFCCLIFLCQPPTSLSWISLWVTLTWMIRVWFQWA